MSIIFYFEKINCCPKEKKRKLINNNRKSSKTTNVGVDSEVFRIDELCSNYLINKQELKSFKIDLSKISFCVCLT